MLCAQIIFLDIHIFFLVLFFIPLQFHDDILHISDNITEISSVSFILVVKDLTKFFLNAQLISWVTVERQIMYVIFLV